MKAKDSEVKDYTLCLGNISKDFQNIEKIGLKGNVFFYVGFNLFDTNHISDIQKYLMKRT